MNQLLNNVSTVDKEETMPNNIIVVNNREDINIVEPTDITPACVYKFTIPQPLFKFLDVFENKDNGQLYGYIHG